MVKPYQGIEHPKRRGCDKEHVDATVSVSGLCRTLRRERALGAPRQMRPDCDLADHVEPEQFITDARRAVLVGVTWKWCILLRRRWVRISLQYSLYELYFNHLRPLASVHPVIRRCVSLHFGGRRKDGRRAHPRWIASRLHPPGGPPRAAQSRRRTVEAAPKLCHDIVIE